LEIRISRPVYDVHCYASRVRRSLQPGSFSSALRIAYGENSAMKVRSLDTAPDESNERAAPRKGDEPRTRLCAENFDLGPCRQAELGLPQKGLGIAGKNHTLSSEPKKYRNAAKTTEERPAAVQMILWGTIIAHLRILSGRLLSIACHFQVLRQDASGHNQSKTLPAFRRRTASAPASSKA
jgi:hypothetical protein